MAAALIQPLAWELPYVTDGAIKRKRRKEKVGVNEPIPSALFVWIPLFRPQPMLENYKKHFFFKIIVILPYGLIFSMTPN